MIINVLWIVLASAIGLGMDQSNQPGAATAEDDTIEHQAMNDCYINGVWYNPCSTDPAPDQPPPPPPDAVSDTNPQ